MNEQRSNQTLSADDPGNSSPDTGIFATYGPGPHPLEEDGSVIYAPGGFGTDPGPNEFEHHMMQNPAPLTITEANHKARFQTRHLYRPLELGDPVTGPNAAHILKDPQLAGKPYPSHQAILKMEEMETERRANDRREAAFRILMTRMSDVSTQTPLPDAGIVRSSFARTAAAIAVCAETIACKIATGGGSVSHDDIKKLGNLTIAMKRMRDIAQPRRQRRTKIGRPQRWERKLPLPDCDES